MRISYNTNLLQNLVGFMIAHLTVTKNHYNKKHTRLFSKLTVKKTKKKKKKTLLIYLKFLTQSMVFMNIFCSVCDYLPLVLSQILSLKILMP